MKKFVSAALIFVLLVTGCAKPQTSDKTDKNVQNTAVTQNTKATEAVSEVVTEPFVPSNVNIMMIGDILVHENVSDSGIVGDGTYNYDHLFTHIAEDVKSSDIAIANEEVILGGRELGLSGYPCFNGPFEICDSLAKVGFNVVLQATNHTIDKGKTGVLNNIAYWKEHYPDMAYLGINESQKEQDEKLYVYEKDGIKIAILNYTYGTNGIPIPSDMPYIVNLLDEDKVVADIKRAKEAADFVIICPHWGTEYVYYATDYQKEWADIFLKNGVDLVIGTHPHVIEPVEWLTDESTGHKMLVYYSIGNYVSGQDKADTMVGAMAKVTVTNDETGKVYISDYSVEPLVTHKERGYAKLAVYKLKDYTDELVSRNYVRNSDGRFSVDYCKSLCREVFKDLYTE